MASATNQMSTRSAHQLSGLQASTADGRDECSGTPEHDEIETCSCGSVEPKRHSPVVRLHEALVAVGDKTAVRTTGSSIMIAEHLLLERILAHELQQVQKISL